MANKLVKVSQLRIAKQYIDERDLATKASIVASLTVVPYRTVVTSALAPSGSTLVTITSPDSVYYVEVYINGIRCRENVEYTYASTTGVIASHIALDVDSVVDVYAHGFLA